MKVQNTLTKIIRKEIIKIVENDDSTTLRKALSDTQTIAAKSNLSYEEGWNALVAQLIIKQGLNATMKMCLDAERKLTKFYKNS